MSVIRWAKNKGKASTFGKELNPSTNPGYSSYGYPPSYGFPSLIERDISAHFESLKIDNEKETSLCQSNISVRTNIVIRSERIDTSLASIEDIIENWVDTYNGPAEQKPLLAFLYLCTCKNLKVDKEVKNYLILEGMVNTRLHIKSRFSMPTLPFRFDFDSTVVNHDGRLFLRFQLELDKTKRQTISALELWNQGIGLYKNKKLSDAKWNMYGLELENLDGEPVLIKNWKY
ncbi:MAG: matrix protein [Hangzhou rhabdovirus 4]|uniref:Matrix protein n=1 Tax=Hangzhou rhabdovirus 4 TaxID=2905393 RepID=A0A8K1XB72_9RHAB|nr:MAG: matrix protein [Hangzhou rhabdovirus 4]